MKNWSLSPSIHRPRSKFDLSHSIKTTMNVGDLVPFYVQEVYPGDTFKVDSTFVARATTPFLKPVMDNLFMDKYYFFVPSRLVWDKWQVLMGENQEGYWANTEEVSVPQCVLDDVVYPQSIANYMGIPSFDFDIMYDNFDIHTSISDLPFRAFAMIWNDWFRDQNTQEPVYIDKTGEDFIYSDGLGSGWNSGSYHDVCPKINKVHDYFTSCLPSPQKGQAVELPLVGEAPVVPRGKLIDEQEIGLRYGAVGSDLADVGNLPNNTWYPMQILHGTGSYFPSVTTGNNSVGGGTPINYQLYPANLWADLSSVYSATVNDLRFAFQLQKMLENDARGGTRYTEILQSHFGVISPDARLQRPEYLGGSRSPLSIQQVTQSTGSDSYDAPLGQVGAFSLSSGNCKFTKGFVEHGFVIGVCAIRYFHTYQQGIERFWRRKNRTDFYLPVFSNIGEQPVYQSELYALADPVNVFGYNEAWADLRYRPNKVTGYLQSYSDGSPDFGSLDIWHFADNYAMGPILNSQFIQETAENVDRTLTVASDETPNFIVDFYVKNSAIRVLPTYSYPGLIDHH